MHQAMFNPNTQGSSDECFTTGMRDLVLHMAPHPVPILAHWWQFLHHMSVVA